jgi:two-component system chemotaxis response regulator CheB
MTNRDIIVVGASAGGVEAISEVVHALPIDFAGSVFVVLHIPASTPSRLPEILSRSGVLPAIAGVDRLPIARGVIYVAPPDRHLLLEDGRIRVSRGPHENFMRPAIDPMFRSAAQSYGSRVIGVVLSGANEDGAAGLEVIKATGGMTMVQDPREAAFPLMPERALAAVSADHVLGARDIGAALGELVGRTGGDIALEPPAPARGLDLIEDPFSIDPAHGRPSVFGCPECGGVLWEVEESGVKSFRCRVGHGYSAEALLEGQRTKVEDVLWTALRAFEESGELARRLARRTQERGHVHAAASFEERARQAEANATVMRQALVNGITSENGHGGPGAITEAGLEDETGVGTGADVSDELSALGDFPNLRVGRPDTGGPSPAHDDRPGHGHRHVGQTRAASE